MARRVFYFCPAYDTPSWGIAMLHAHVRMLRDCGEDAYLLFENPSPPMDWFEAEVPSRLLSEITSSSSENDILRENDVLVVPEVFAAHKTLLSLSCRRIVFVQGGFLIHKGLVSHKDYRSLGYEHAMVILPHMQGIVETHYNVPTYLVSPYIADYFFVDDNERGHTRAKTILMIPKHAYREVGYYDYDIVVSNLSRMLSEFADWNLLEVSGMTHREVARLMQSATFFVSVNCLEGFNTTVPEAMAAGCVPVCYRGFGGRDFLKPNENALVFENNDVYAILEKLHFMMANFSSKQEEICLLRQAAIHTAREYTYDRTKSELLGFFSEL